MSTVTFTAQKREELRRAYTQALADKSDTFLFQGHELLVSYAKYLLEFLDKSI